MLLLQSKCRPACVSLIFSTSRIPQPEQNKQTRPGSSSAEPRQGHMTSGGSELRHLMSHGAAACRVASVSGVCQRFRGSVQKPSAAVTAASKLPNANSLSSKNSTATSFEALKHRLSLSKLATRRLFPIECCCKKVRFLLLNVRGGGGGVQPLVVVHHSQLCASADTTPQLTQSRNISPAASTLGLDPQFGKLTGIKVFE